MHASPHFHAAAHAFSTTRALTHRAALRACVRRQPAIYRTPAYSAGSRWPDLATSSQPLQTCRRPSVLASSVRFASGRSIISLLEVEWLIPMILSEPSDFHIHIHITCVYSLLFGHVRVLHASARLPIAQVGVWLAALVGSGLVLVRGRRRAMVLYLPQ
jgi:hypothetical protein